MGRRKRKSRNFLDDAQSVSTPSAREQPPPQQQQSNCYEGDRLVRLLKSLKREIEAAKSSKGVLPEKIWVKQQFSIGINDVTRTLERMTPNPELPRSTQEPTLDSGSCKGPSVHLQAVLLASDCNPRMLTKHILSLALSRSVPLIFVKDKKAGSLRLGELVKLKTAIAIGIKDKGTGINKLITEILHERGDGEGI